VRKAFIAASSLFVLTVVAVALAQGPPPLPPEHIPIAPGEDAAVCYQCHESPPPLDPDVSSFCTYCHEFAYSHRTAPPPAHPVNFEWPSRDCGTCHRLHATPPTR